MERNRKGRRTAAQSCLLATALIICTALVRAEGVQVNANGVRLFPKPPTPGVHPRVLITDSDKAALKRRVYDTDFGRQILQPIIASSRKIVEKEHAKLIAAEPDPATLPKTKQWAGNEGRSQSWGVAALEAWMNDDQALKKTLIESAVRHSELILASREAPESIWDRQNFWRVKGETGTDWGLGDENFVGGIGIAAVYDLLYDDMTDQERATIRKMISAAISGRRPHGLGWPKTKLFSNWVPLHAVMGIQMLVIEGEDGYDPEIYELWVQTIRNFLDVTLSPKGANHEDHYITYAFRGGAPLMYVAQRRGEDMFGHEHYRNLQRWMLNWFTATDDMSGYSTFYAVTKYMLPEDSLVNAVWRLRVGAQYENRLNWQCHFWNVLCGLPYDGTPEEAANLARVGLPESEFYPRRGLQIARNSWQPDDLILRTYFRPDSMVVGHAAVDAGTFDLKGLGRIWVYHNIGDKAMSHSSLDNTLVHIDGKAEGMKPPSTKVLHQQNRGDATIIAGDITYAYNWQWYYGWPLPPHRPLPSAPWEPEPNDPYKLGWPAEEDWMPHSISEQPDVGFCGLWQMRKRYSEVQYAYRTTLLVRGEPPYVLIIDDVKKDDEQHLYEWYMQTPLDLDLALMHDNNIILNEQSEETRGKHAVPGSRRMLVRVLEPYDDMPEEYDQAGFIQHASLQKHQYRYKINKGKVQIAQGKRLMIPWSGTEGNFKTLLMPFRVTNDASDPQWVEHMAGTPLPKTRMSQDGRTLTVSIGEVIDVFTFDKPADGRTRVMMQRNGRQVLTGN